MTNTEKEFAAHHAFVCAEYGEKNVFATMLYGSQNYGLATPESDVDTKVMVLPSLHEVALGSDMVSVEHKVGDALTNVKDVRMMFKNFLKSNINFLECLFTEYTVVNPTYQTFWDELYAAREFVATSQPSKLMHAARGMAKQKYAAFEKPYAGKLDVLEKYGYDPKQLHHLARLRFFMNTFMWCNSFEESLQPHPEQFEFLMALKATPLPYEEAKRELEFQMSGVEAAMRKAEKRYVNADKPAEVKAFLDDLSYRLVKTHLTNELMEAR